MVTSAPPSFETTNSPPVAATRSAEINLTGILGTISTSWRVTWQDCPSELLTNPVNVPTPVTFSLSPSPITTPDLDSTPVSPAADGAMDAVAPESTIQLCVPDSAGAPIATKV